MKTRQEEVLFTAFLRDRVSTANALVFPLSNKKIAKRSPNEKMLQHKYKRSMDDREFLFTGSTISKNALPFTACLKDETSPF
ncbi:MAG: hypothetical protein ABI443_08155 [Chthoniobacterales bacterium]